MDFFINLILLYALLSCSVAAVYMYKLSSKRGKHGRWYEWIIAFVLTAIFWPYVYYVEHFSN